MSVLMGSSGPAKGSARAQSSSLVSPNGLFVFIYALSRVQYATLHTPRVCEVPGSGLSLS